MREGTSGEMTLSVSGSGIVHTTPPGRKGTAGQCQNPSVGGTAASADWLALFRIFEREVSTAHNTRVVDCCGLTMETQGVTPTSSWGCVPAESFMSWWMVS